MPSFQVLLPLKEVPALSWCLVPSPPSSLLPRVWTSLGALLSAWSWPGHLCQDQACVPSILSEPPTGFLVWVGAAEGWVWARISLSLSLS